MAKKASVPQLIGSVIAGAAGAAFGYWLAKGSLGDAGSSTWLGRALDTLGTADLLAIPVLFLLVIAVHELGHLLGGLSQGMRFLLLIFGPFQWSATSEGIRFRWVTNLGLMGGIAATLPVKMDNLRRQTLPMIAGGPLASLALTLAGGALAASLDGRAGAYAAIVALLSLAIFLVTAFPFRAGGFMSDGMQFIEVLRGGVAIVERTDLLRLSCSSLSGVRPRDWEPALVTRVESMQSAEPLRQLACWMLLLQRAMDGGDSDQARDLAARLADKLDLYPDGFRQNLHIELCIEAGLRRDLATAEGQLAQAKGGVTERSRLELARALVCLLRGDISGMESHRTVGRRALRHAMDPGLAKLTADQLEGLHVSP